MNKPGEKKREPTESTFLATMARVPLKSNFSINAILPEIADRDTPPDDDGSPVPSAPSEMDDASSDGDVNVDYESENEGKHPENTILVNLWNLLLYILFMCERRLSVCMFNE